MNDGSRSEIPRTVVSCIRCGFAMVESGCKVRCDRCGLFYDCSDGMLPMPEAGMPAPGCPEDEEPAL